MYFCDCIIYIAATIDMSSIGNFFLQKEDQQKLKEQLDSMELRLVLAANEIDGLQKKIALKESIGERNINLILALVDEKARIYTETAASFKEKLQKKEDELYAAQVKVKELLKENDITRTLLEEEKRLVVRLCDENGELKAIIDDNMVPNIIYSSHSDSTSMDNKKPNSLEPISTEADLVTKVAFIVEGSKGDEYCVSFYHQDNEIIATCTCPAGGKGSFCKHRLNILKGSFDGVLDGSESDIKLILGWLPDTKLDAALKELQLEEAQLESIKKTVSNSKKHLSKILYGHYEKE